MVELVRELEFPSQPGGLILASVVLVENLQRHSTIRDRRRGAPGTRWRIRPGPGSRRRRSPRSPRRPEARFQPRSASGGLFSPHDYLSCGVSALMSCRVQRQYRLRVGSHRVGHRAGAGQGQPVSGRRRSPRRRLPRADDRLSRGFAARRGHRPQRRRAVAGAGGGGRRVAAHRRAQPRVAGRRADGRARRPGSRRRDHHREVDPGRRRAWRAAAPTRPRYWSRSTRCGSSACRAATCTHWPPGWAATCRSRCTAARRWAPAAARNWRPCWPGTRSTGCWRSPTAACPRRPCSPRSTGCASRSDRSLPPRLEDPEPVLAALASGDPAALAPLLGNDLQPASLSLDPGLRRTLRAGVEAGALAGIVSGSGPDVRVPVRLVPRRPSTSAPSWPEPGYAARCGWPAVRCRARGWSRRRTPRESVTRASITALVWQLLKSCLR